MKYVTGLLGLMFLGNLFLLAGISARFTPLGFWSQFAVCAFLAAFHLWYSLKLLLFERRIEAARSHVARVLETPRLQAALARIAGLPYEQQQEALPVWLQSKARHAACRDLLFHGVRKEAWGGILRLGRAPDLPDSVPDDRKALWLAPLQPWLPPAHA